MGSSSSGDWGHMYSLGGHDVASQAWKLDDSVTLRCGGRHNRARHKERHDCVRQTQNRTAKSFIQIHQTHCYHLTIYVELLSLNALAARRRWLITLQLRNTTFLLLASLARNGVSGGVTNLIFDVHSDVDTHTHAYQVPIRWGRPDEFAFPLRDRASVSYVRGFSF